MNVKINEFPIWVIIKHFSFKVGKIKDLKIHIMLSSTINYFRQLSIKILAVNE
jgi:hypothetical protein